ncbi:class I SAM-dependent methyltransferase [Nostoc sp.]|uniref:class I SAM-dependent methyltransferase n=1 Tax=Nostoc sp. TaxID=1180 RepID=UPI002FF816B2
MKINRNLIQKTLFGIHKLGIKFGIHILPVHYYSPIPNILELEQTRDVWAKKSELPGVSVNLDQQTATLKAICMPYQSEYVGNKVYLEGVSNHFGPGYGYIEAQALHAFVRHYKPKRIVEVGSGVSTYCMLKASEINARETQQHTKIVSIEPYPSERLRSLSQIELIPKQVQTVPIEIFTELGQNDLLFIDSSHTVKPGGDVNYLLLEVLPRLHQGVVVHFHDIFLPYDYQRDVCRTFHHWAETSLLHAFLLFNERVKILACLSHLHYECKNVLREVFPEYNPQAEINGLTPEKYKLFDAIPEHFPSSIYIQIQ